jgi:alkanesulfonate monooxygenase SsuD/methylene tetrahydromethanopterin reductase-like flavin-dependent oxidoreductase (luciferase family)
MFVGVGLYSMRSEAGEWARAYADFLEDARFVEALGFHSLWVAEHHFAADGWCPAPLVAAAAALGVTSTLHVGTGIHLLPLYDPHDALAEVNRLVERSGGRFEHGVGLGYRAEEYAGYGLSVKQRGKRMDAALEVFADSRAPIWVGGFAEPALARAARFGCNLLLPSTLTAAQLGRALGQATGKVALMKYTWAGDGVEDALAWHDRSVRSYTEAWFKLQGSSVDDQMRRTVDTGLFGTVDQVAAQVREYEALGIDLLILHVVADGRHPRRRACLERLAEALL